MRNKFILFCLIGLAFIAVVVNSCKKSNKDYIETLFPGGQWQLASTMRYHVLNNATLKTDTLNAICDSAQVFTFFDNNTCTYAHFDCQPQPKASGTWSLSSSKLILMANMTCTDSVKNQVQPFSNARIMNLGQYSLVLRTGEYNTYYPAGDTVVYTEYSFVRVKLQ